MNDKKAVDNPSQPLPDDLETEEFAQLLAQANAEQTDAWDRIYALLYPDLHRIARAQIRRLASPRMSATSLISETWLKLAGARLDVASRQHLTFLIARAMRFVLIDETRRALTQTHAPQAHLPLPDALPDTAACGRLEQLLTLNQALNDLAAIDRRLARVVELRYFGGLNEGEVAQVLDLTERTVSRDWRKARAWLLTRLGHDGREIAI